MTQKPWSAPRSIGSIGDITALASVSTSFSSYICVGVASQILIFDVHTGKKLTEACWEGGVRIHGIRVSEAVGEIDDDGDDDGRRSGDGGVDGDGSSSSSTSSTFLLVAHGDRGAASYLLSIGGASASLKETWRRSFFSAWTLDAVPFSKSRNAKSSVVVAVGAADGSVSLHRAPLSPSPSSVDLDPPLLESRCAERCLFYSMALLAKENEEETEFWVAGGSVFLDVLIWKIKISSPSSSSPSSPSSASSPVSSCPVLFRLSGHEGSIHRVAWAPLRAGTRDSEEKTEEKKEEKKQSSLLLASASDDRTLRLWSVPTSSGSSGSEQQRQRQVLPGPVFRGHGARLWDIVFVPAPAPDSPSSAGGEEGEVNGDSLASSSSSSASAFSSSFGSAVTSSSSSSSSSYPPRFVLSTSEDCSARLWSVLGGGGGGDGRRKAGERSLASVAALRGHRGRGIWRAAAVFSSPASPSSSLPLIATAGADGAVQLWRLSDHVSFRNEGEEGRLLGSPPPGGGEEETSSPFPSSSPSSSSSSATAARTLYAAGPGVLLVGTGDGAVWRVDLGVSEKEEEEGGGEGEKSGEGKSGARREKEKPRPDSWSLVFRAPRAGSVLSLAAVPCRRHGFFDVEERGGGEGESNSSRSFPLSCASSSSSSSASFSSAADKITRITPLLVLAALGRGEAALGCDCARFFGRRRRSSSSSKNPEAAPELRWSAVPAGETGVPLFRCFLPRELGGGVALTTSTLGDLSVWKLPRMNGNGDEGRPTLPPLLVAAAPPRRARRQRDLAVSCVSACGLRRMLFAGDSAGGVMVYSLPDSLFSDDGDGEEDETDRERKEEEETPVLEVAAKARTPDESAVTCLRLLPRPSPPPSSSSSQQKALPEEDDCNCCGELRIGDCVGRATTLRLSRNSSSELPKSSTSTLTSTSYPFSLPAVGAERLPFPLVSSDAAHPDPSVSRRERVVCGFSGDTWIAVSYPGAGGGEQEEGQQEEEGSCFEVARATTGGWRRPAALVPGCPGSDSLPAVPAALVHCVLHRRGGGENANGNGEGGDLVAREWGSRNGAGGGRRSSETSTAAVAAAASATAAPLARVELPAGHGLEVHASIALPSTSPDHAAVLTASEEGSLRWLLVRNAGGGKKREDRNSTLSASGLVRALSDGSALRACASVRTPGSSKDDEDFLVFASGVRAYVTAWRAWWSGGSGSGGGGEEEGGKEKGEKVVEVGAKKTTTAAAKKKHFAPPRLHTAWLSASSAGTRSGRAARQASSRSAKAEANPRALHAAAFEIDVGEEEEEERATKKKGVVAVLVATSLGDVEAVAFDPASGEFLPSGASGSSDPVRLECHEGPALCVAHLRTKNENNGLAFSGSTDGAVAVWSGAEISRALLLPPSPSLSAAAVVRPLALLPALHQSGVNCLAVAALEEEKKQDSKSVLLVTGGDDGALRATLLSVSPPSSSEPRRPEVSVLALTSVEGAHSSCSLRGAWISGEIEGKSAEVVTVGLDQRLRGWSLSISASIDKSENKSETEKGPPSLSVSLRPLWSVPVQVPAPESLAVLPERGLVSVSGRGTQAFSWE